MKVWGKCRNPLKIIANAEIHSNSQNYIIVILVATPPCTENTAITGTPIQPGIKLASSSTVLLSDLLSVFFPSFFFLYHTSAIFFQFWREMLHPEWKRCQTEVVSSRTLLGCTEARHGGIILSRLPEYKLGKEEGSSIE